MRSLIGGLEKGRFMKLRVGQMRNVLVVASLLMLSSGVQAQENAAEKNKGTAPGAKQTPDLKKPSLQAPAKPKKTPPPAYLTPEEAGVDFQLQGEYRGYIRPLGSARASQSMGLQVIAQGNDEFTGTVYYGGLPGAGWQKGDRYEYVGKKFGDIVRLNSRNYEIELDGERAYIYSAEGLRIGELKKIYRVSPTLGAAPPEGAIVLFDGKKDCGFVNPKITDDGLLREGTQTVDNFGDFRLHAEFMLPFKPLGRGQDRGNSGFYIQGRYELQVLDSFGLEGIENECGAVYKTKRPNLNMCLPPLTWQTYDIEFTMPKFNDQGDKISDMKLTVWHNGVLIHHQANIPNKTGAGIVEGPTPLPTKLQDHANPVLYRNIWILSKDQDNSTHQDWVKLPLQGPPTPISSSQPAGAIMAVSPAGVITLGNR